VVPPTVLRAFPVDWYRGREAGADATLGTESIVVTIQYWLFQVGQEDIWDADRFRADTAYARHVADFNILTYLIRHNDQNMGNFVISTDSSNPRVFSVDNGLAFSSPVSDRGARWRNLLVERLPAGTIERLRHVTRGDLDRQLETVTQFRIRDDGRLEWMEPTENTDRGEGVRRNDDVVQFGLTEREIRDVWRRLQDLLRDIDRGRYEVF